MTCNCSRRWIKVNRCGWWWRTRLIEPIKRKRIRKNKLQLFLFNNKQRGNTCVCVFACVCVCLLAHAQSRRNLKKKARRATLCQVKAKQHTNNLRCYLSSYLSIVRLEPKQTNTYHAHFIYSLVFCCWKKNETKNLKTMNNEGE